MAEGGSSRPGGRVRIAVPEQYRALNEEVWSDLESYLFRGFLTSPSHLFDRTFVFKTLNHHELTYVRQFRPLRTSPMNVQASYRAYFIAYSLFIVDGENVLYKRPDHIRKIVGIVSAMDPAVQEEIVANIAALNERAARLHPLTEVYVHEPRSRFRWLHAKGSPLHSTINTGVPGTEDIGMNYCQQAWTALNRILDHREVSEYQWAHAKFVGSCWSKGVRAVEERDKARKEKERSDLEDLKMKVLYRYLNRLSDKEEPEGLYRLPDGRMATVSKWHRSDSVDELADQLEKAVNNEKDHHDMVIERKLRQHQNQAMDLSEARKAVWRAPAILGASEGAEKVGGSSQVVRGGKDEIQARFERLRGLQRQQMTEFYRKSEQEAVRQAFNSDDPEKDRR